MRQSSSQLLPQWLLDLENDEIEFMRAFILSSGSLKEIAKIYEVSYPTVRLRLDRLIDKIKNSPTHNDGELISLIKNLAIDDKIPIDIAKLLIDTYREENDK